MVNVMEEVVFVSKLIPVVILAAQVSLENVQVIQMMLNVVIIFLVQLMMEEKVIVYLQINVLVIKLVENAQEVVISNVVLVEDQLLILQKKKIIHIMVLALEVMELVSILISILVILI